MKQLHLSLKIRLLFWACAFALAWLVSGPPPLWWWIVVVFLIVAFAYYFVRETLDIRARERDR